MKKTIITTLALAPLFLVPFTSCQKVTEDDVQTLPKTISRTVAVSTEDIDSPEVKSVFESGVGVHLTNNEYMSVYYAASDGDRTISGLNSQILGTPDGNGNWTFSHGAVSGAESYDYAFVLPYTSKNELSGGKQHKLRLYFVQNPSATSFDPNLDFLLGKAKIGVEQGSECSGVVFKRLFAPVKVEISDGANALGAEKVHAVSFSLDKAATQDDAIVGWVYATPSDDYNSAAVTRFANEAADNVNMPHFSNAVSALNASGIEKTDGKYPVWFIMNPSSIPAGTKLTLTVTTDTKTVTRTATLTKDAAIGRDKINVIPFDISGADYSVETSAYCDFSTIRTYNNIPMTDGTKPLTASGCSMRGLANGSEELKCLQMLQTSSLLKITPVTGKTLSKIRLYTHRVTPSNKSKLTLKDGDTVLETKPIRVPDVAATAGYLDFEISEENASSTLTLNYTDSGSYLAGITLFYK